ncbi:peptidase, partial [Methanosalsum natronophilum]
MSDASSESPVDSSSNIENENKNEDGPCTKNIKMLENEVESLKVQNESMKAKLLDANMR